uniref:DUF2330 domain-containing protein n=1 Tax=Magnetococcus massalia (strain MO-1) TaxID=451514 RepID=A0A1S7LGQ0_MAGMO|nr:Conserved hypothetical protein; putative signal peptide [Candidatus Magnetococcus massalia]
MLRFLIPLFALVTLLTPQLAAAFCGFYVARAESELFNEASRVVLVRDGHRTVLTMASDYKGEATDFAMVVPVPTFIEKGQIHVGNMATIDHLDAYSAPRLVEYHDPNPCAPPRMERMAMAMMDAAPQFKRGAKQRAKALGVTIEAEYNIGEYDIVILSAKQSDGLAEWLLQSGYKLPPGAVKVLGSYIKQEMRFFVAKVNLKQHAKLGYQFLRPLQVAYETPKFMLPIRLGMVNADGPQELFVFTLTRKGRVESRNYRTVKLPSGMDLPTLIKPKFADFYRDMFRKQVEKEQGKAVFMEYAWDMNWCDPCAADPLSVDELRELGVFWVKRDKPVEITPFPMPTPRRLRPPPQQKRDVFVTRLHVRYEKENFPEDLMFQMTGDKRNFQARYVLRHPWTGELKCEQGKEYQRQVAERQEEELRRLVELTGWEVAQTRKEAGLPEKPKGSGEKWWEDLWR